MIVSMLGAIVGDIIGSTYEFLGEKRHDILLFAHGSTFTDDTVLTVAVAESLLTGRDYVDTFKEFSRRHPNRGYGTHYYVWMKSENRQPYNSWGNGSAMRVSPVAWARDTLEDVLAEAERSAAVTHDHPEGIAGAQATALAVFLARVGADKQEIKAQVTARFGYDLDRTPDEIRPEYEFDVSCQGSVPESITCFLHSESYEDAIRLAASLGGDVDTMAAIAGGIAEAYYGGVPDELAERGIEYLTDDLRDVVVRFRDRYVTNRSR
jgi:ADP-ribosylglycohydrolase